MPSDRPGPGPGRAPRHVGARAAGVASPGRTLRPMAVLALAGGLALGVYWLLAAPRPQAVWTGTLWWSETEPDLWASQDWAFVLGAVAAGALGGVWLILTLDRPRPLLRVTGALAAGLVGSALALALGTFLGAGPADPDPGASARAALELHAGSALAVWPLVTALLAALYAAVDSVVRRDR